MMAPPSSPPLVWITQGKTQHAAFVLEESSDGKKKVQWATTKKTEWMDANIKIEQELTPRRHRRRQREEQEPSLYVTPPRSSKRHRLTTGSLFLSPNTSSNKNPRRISLERPSDAKTSKDAATSIATTSASSCPPSGPDNADIDDDSSVEVLLTIFPPSPKKKVVHIPKQQQQQQQQPGILDAVGAKVDDISFNTNNALLNTSVVSNGTSSDGQSAGSTRNGLLEESATVPNADKESSEQKSYHETRALLQSKDRESGDPENGERSIATSYSAMYSSMEMDAEKKPAALDSGASAPTVDTATKDDSGSKPSYTFVSSAYLQNLAEICHTILEDQRWRVGANQERLFSWQQGDDLTAVLMLSRRFTPPNYSIQGKTGARQKQEDIATSMPCATLLPENNTYSQQHSVKNTDSIEDSVEDRALYLYSRLFYRKGPWFRLDDIYSKYFAPAVAPTATKDNQEPQSHFRASVHKTQKAQPKRDKHSFFQTRPSKTKSAEESPKANNSVDAALIHEDLFGQHLAALKRLFQDVLRLKQMGLIRTFYNEEECGKTVGMARVLLTVEERRQVLLKLGGGKNGAAASQKRQQNKGNFTSGRGSSNFESSSSSSSENEIWRQMSQQRSISAFQIKKPQLNPEQGQQEDSGIKKKQSSSVMPVNQHVCRIILDKWTMSIVQACSSAEYVPAIIMKARQAAIKDAIANILSELSIGLNCSMKVGTTGLGLEGALGEMGLCMRLREPPLVALQRCARLYLCATSGPGGMRSDGGTNGWKSIREVDRNAVLNNSRLKDADYAKNVEPPGAHSWYSVTYPGLTDRFGLASFCFKDAHTFIEASSPQPGGSDVHIVSSDRIFFSVDSFQGWEMAAEIRSNADYLIEVNELLLYNERKRAREDRSYGKENESRTTLRGNGDASNADTSRPMDFLGVMTPNGRKSIIKPFLAAHNGVSCGAVDRLQALIEHDISQVRLCVDSSSDDEEAEADLLGHRLKTECEEILVSLGLLIKNILVLRTKEISEVELKATITRPWLRHLSWDACLAYILWDIIPIFERRGLYKFAIQSLELLVHGSAASLEKVTTPTPNAPLTTKALLELDIHIDTREKKISVAFAHFLLSRRARGKALDRLMIDLTHLLRLQEKSQPKTAQKKKNGAKKTQGEAAAKQALISKLSFDVLKSTVENASVSFSSIRTLSRRLKQPLSETLKDLSSQEALELGLRLACPADREQKKGRATQYSDWMAITDYARANSVAIGECVVGRRCSFVGHEDDQNAAAFTASLNVEQLAMEFYNTGRLPEQSPCQNSSTFIKGGWLGWHDEGGMVRALFRIMSFDVIGMDWGQKSVNVEDTSRQELSTIHLSPYQGAPFDLHVGYEQSEPFTVAGASVSFNRGFYLRRKESIDGFLRRLETLNEQQVSDLVWESIAARRKHVVDSSRKDPFLEKDVLQTRTLSLVAAGFGGKMLSAIFRCFFFDYRHYSGGLPDLLMVRARYDATASLVDLGDYIGEAFDKEYLSQLEVQQRASLLGDRDEDFLGCSKVGDSGGGGSRGRRGRMQSNSNGADSGKRRVASSIPELSPKLDLSHNGKDVKVECMFVEVKSHNDRLDARQEDWLNVLDLYGNARVCKFISEEEKSKTKATKMSGTLKNPPNTQADDIVHCS